MNKKRLADNIGLVKQNVTRHAKRAFKSKIIKLIFIVDMIHNFLFYEIFNILQLVM